MYRLMHKPRCRHDEKSGVKRYQRRYEGAKFARVFMAFALLSISVWSILQSSLLEVPSMRVSTPEVLQPFQYNEKAKPAHLFTSKSQSLFDEESPYRSDSSTNGKPRLVIAGAVQSVELYLDGIRQNLVRLLKDFQLIQMVFFENDSTDATVSVLQSWVARESWKVNVISLPGLNMKVKKRTSRLAIARRELWQAIREIDEGGQIDFVLMLDMDDMTVHLAHVEECFNLPAGWDGCCANSYWWYYDLWALRTFDEWTNCDFRYDCPDVNSTNKKTRNDVTWKRMKHLPASLPPIAVKSCFGGAVLYRYETLRQLNLTGYKGTYRDGSEVCEHVPFHESLRQQLSTFQLFIQPKMLTDGKPQISNPRVRSRLMQQSRKSHENQTLSHYYSTMNTFT